MGQFFLGAREIANMHPLVVHYPIALLNAFVIAEILGLFFKNKGLKSAASFCLYLGTLAAAVTVAAGLRAASTVAHNEAVHEIMLRHTTFGITVLSMGIILSLWRAFTGGRFSSLAQALHLALGVIMVVVMAFGADLGGLMVFKYGVAVKAVKTEGGGGHAHGKAHHATEDSTGTLEPEHHHETHGDHAHGKHHHETEANAGTLEPEHHHEADGHGH